MLSEDPPEVSASEVDDVVLSSQSVPHDVPEEASGAMVVDDPGTTPLVDVSVVVASGVCVVPEPPDDEASALISTQALPTPSPENSA